MRFLLTWLLLAAPLWAQKKTIFLITDAEGVGGGCRQEQTEPKDQEMRALLTGEINAAVDGFLQGGADEVIVWDGHDGSQTLSTLTIHPRARLVIGALPASMLMERRWRQLPLALFYTWFTVDGCYALYWYFKDPAALEAMREANFFASLALYGICGVVWLYRGSLREMWGEARSGLLRR